MKLKFAICAMVAGLALVALPMAAHHSFAAEYDNSKPVSIKGKAIKMDWVNPHSHLTLEVTTPEGKTEVWAAETPPPNGLYRAGWRKSDLNVGDSVTLVDSSPARNGSTKAYGGKLTLADGRIVFSGSAANDQ